MASVRSIPYQRPHWWQTRHGKNQIANAVTYVLLTVLTAVIVFPYFWIASSVLRPGEKLYSGELLPSPFTLENFVLAAQQPSFLLPMRNSFIVAGSTALLSITLCSLAAYSLSKYRYRGKTVFTVMILMINLLPGVLLVIPLFIMLRSLGLYNSFAGLVLSATTFSAPAAMLLLRGFFNSLPEELVDSAMIDGCTKLGALWRVILPLTLPGLVTVMMICFVQVWNDVLFALVLTRDVTTQTVSVALNTQAQKQFAVVDWSVILAQGLLVTLPILILFAFFQRYLIQGLASGSIK
jgi:multiple sugar transport system permease protein